MVKNELMGQAVTDRVTLKKHPATAWQDDPDDKTRQFRMSEHYDREEPTRQFRTKPGLKPKSVSGSKNIFDALGDA